MDGRDFTLDSGLTLQNTPTYHDLGREDTKQNEKGGAPLEHHPSHVKEIWKFHLRPAEDDEPQCVLRRSYATCHSCRTELTTTV